MFSLKFTSMLRENKKRYIGEGILTFHKNDKDKLSGLIEINGKIFYMSCNNEVSFGDNSIHFHLFSYNNTIAEKALERDFMVNLKGLCPDIITTIKSFRKIATKSGNLFIFRFFNNIAILKEENYLIAVNKLAKKRKESIRNMYSKMLKFVSGK